VPTSKVSLFLRDTLTFFGGGVFLGYGLSRIPLTGFTEKNVVTLLIGLGNIALLRSGLRLRYVGFWSLMAGAIGVAYFIALKLGGYPRVAAFEGRALWLSAGWYGLLLIVGLAAIRRLGNRPDAEMDARGDA
jgi:hypothetical protein